MIDKSPERLGRLVTDLRLAKVLLHLVELAGLGEALQLIWGLIFRLRHLSAVEQRASASVHPAGLIPYDDVLVDDDSVLIRIGVFLATLLNTKVSPGAITTMHIVHGPKGGLPPPAAVHELTHVAQYELVGAIYMPEAIRAQNSAAGYDYGDLTMAWAAGRRFSDFNREQQASICEDFYQVNNGLPAEFGATLERTGAFHRGHAGAPVLSQPRRLATKTGICRSVLVWYSA